MTTRGGTSRSRRCRPGRLPWSVQPVGGRHGPQVREPARPDPAAAGRRLCRAAGGTRAVPGQPPPPGRRRPAAVPVRHPRRRGHREDLPAPAVHPARAGERLPHRLDRRVGLRHPGRPRSDLGEPRAAGRAVQGVRETGGDLPQAPVRAGLRPGGSGGAFVRADALGGAHRPPRRRGHPARRAVREGAEHRRGRRPGRPAAGLPQRQAAQPPRRPADAVAGRGAHPAVRGRPRRDRGRAAGRPLLRHLRAHRRLPSTRGCGRCCRAATATCPRTWSSSWPASTPWTSTPGATTWASARTSRCRCSPRRRRSNCWPRRA